MLIKDIPLLGEYYLSLLERLYKEYDPILSLNELVSVKEIEDTNYTSNGVEYIKTLYYHFDDLKIYKQQDRSFYISTTEYMYIEYNIDIDNKIEMYCLGGFIHNAVVVIFKTTRSSNGCTSRTDRVRPDQSDPKICKIIYEIFGKLQNVLKEYDRAAAIDG